ncbi:hypothetical protein [Fervidobacterium sp.]
MIYVKLFGDWKVYKDGVEILEFKSKKALKILFYAILTERSRISVEEIVKIFWPRYELDYARKNLNAQLYYIRKDLDIPDYYLKNEREYLYIEQNFFKSDYKEFMEATKLGDVRKLELLYTGILLDGLTDEWIIKYRFKCQKIYEEATKSIGISEKTKELYETVNKLGIIFQHQMLTREKYFIPVLIRKKHVCQEIKLRRGDFLLDSETECLVVLERGEKSYYDVVKGFLDRIKVNFEDIQLLNETEVLNWINNLFELKVAIDHSL